MSSLTIIILCLFVLPFFFLFHHLNLCDDILYYEKCIIIITWRQNRMFQNLIIILKLFVVTSTRKLAFDDIICINICIIVRALVVSAAQNWSSYVLGMNDGILSKVIKMNYGIDLVPSTSGFCLFHLHFAGWIHIFAHKIMPFCFGIAAVADVSTSSVLRGTFFNEVQNRIAIASRRRDNRKIIISKRTTHTQRKHTGQIVILLSIVIIVCTSF